MSIIKSFSVGNGDMFYIKHNSGDLTVIDCCLDDSDHGKKNLDEIVNMSNQGNIRFISTHPDNDHIKGLSILDNELNITDFYVVENETKKVDGTKDFDKYCELKDSNKASYLYRGCENSLFVSLINGKNQDNVQSPTDRLLASFRDNNCKNKTSLDRYAVLSRLGFKILWPVVDNIHYKQALESAKHDLSPNNISPIIMYSENGINMVFMGDLESDFMHKIKIETPISLVDLLNKEKNFKDRNIDSVDILFAPHHGRDSGKIPELWLNRMKPKVIVIGEAPSEHLNYYNGYNTIKQNSAGDILFECYTFKVDIYVEDSLYKEEFLSKESGSISKYNLYYLGTLNVGSAKTFNILKGGKDTGSIATTPPWSV